MRGQAESEAARAKAYEFDAAAGKPDASKRRDRVAEWVFALGVAAFLLPPAAAAVALIAAGVPDIPLQADRALIEIQTRATVSGEPPLVGPYSRFGFSHPGPLLFYLYAVPYLAFGGDAGALPLAVLILNAAALIGLNLIVRRAAGPAAAAWTACLCVLWVRFTGGALIEIWNPYAGIQPFLLACVALAAFAGGLAGSLAVAALAGTLALQSHVGYAPSLFVAGAAALALRIRPAAGSTGSGPHRWSRGAMAGIGLALLAWVPPLIDQLTAPRGNATTLLGFIAAHPSRRGWGEALSSAPAVLAALPASLLPAAGGGAAAALLFVQVLAVGAATWWAARHRRAFYAALGVLTLGLHATAIVSMRAIVGPTESYLIHWMTGIGFLSWLLVGAVAADRLGPGTRRVSIGVLGAVCAWGSGTAAIGLAAETRSLMAGNDDDAAWRKVAAECLRIGIDRGWSGWVVRYADDDSWYRLTDLVNRLQKGGLPVVIDPDRSWQYPPSYRSREPASGTLLVGDRDLLDRLPAGGPGVVIGQAGRVALAAIPFGAPVEGTWPFAMLHALSPRSTGFSTTKRVGDETYLWSDGDESSVTIPLRRGLAHRLSLEVMPYLASGGSQTLTVAAAGAEPSVFPLRMEKRWQRVDVDLPADAASDWRELRFSYAGTHPRSDVAITADFIRLGVAFRTLSVGPLPAP